MASPAAIGEAFRRLQGGDAAGALELARRIAADEPRNARAHLAIGIALRIAGRYEEACEALERAEALDPSDHAPAYELGVVRQLQARPGDALAAFERSAGIKPDFFAAHFSAGLLHAERREWGPAADRFRAVLSVKPDMPEALLYLANVLERDGRHAEAEASYVHALAANPHHPATLRVFGQYSASRGNFKRAASLFTEAARLEPGDAALPMFVAQCELLLGRWQPAWGAYARRVPRLEYERAAAARGVPYAVPSRDRLNGERVTLVGEQGLGDTLFFLRWASRVRDAGARIAFSGDARLHSLLARTGLFQSFASADESPAGIPILAGDLPAVFADADPLEARSLQIAPLPDRLEEWRTTLQAAGPKPWIGTLWRAGTPGHVVAHALAKAVPVADLFAALAPLGGTVFSLQRDPVPGEIDVAGRSLGARVHDLSHANADLEDVLALVALLDRHVSVSNTNLHLAVAAGSSADVLMPFPPEWRWRLEGDSPWFPGFRVHRQGIEGDWSAALAALARR
jgi:tetratricopeptide (TPR) repeat protein